MREDWAEVEYGQLLDYEQPTKYIVESTAYNDSYPIPVLTAGKTFIKGYTNETDGIFNEIPVIIFDDFTTASRYVNFEFKVKSSAMKILKPKHPLVNMKFMGYAMQADTIRSDTHKRYWISVYAKKKFFLPPLPEQRVIVSKIEELFSELDNGVANLKTAQEQLKVYRQAVLKKAFEGELTKEWRGKQKDLPTAEELLKQIHEERDAHYQQQLADWKEAVKLWENEGKKGKKPKKPRVLKDFAEIESDVKEKLKELPVSWNWSSWESILAYGDASFKRGPFGSALKKAFFVSSGYKVYEQYCPINDDCSFERYYITEEKFKELQGFAVQADDFLISCSGVSLGRITQVPQEFKEGVINQALLRLRLNFGVYDSTFFKHMFRSPFFQKQIFENSMGTAIPNVKSVTELKSIPVPILSKEEQHQIVQEIESRLSVCDKLEESITQSLPKAEALRQSILKKAFEGRLITEQELAACRKEEDWEPAKELLQKLKINT